ncbi:ECF transporter S component [Streptomyces fradiae]|uniref:ECF transporter S component n=1 Tax=Streptomyces fradiae TaxID=1906 RepID=UPI002941DBD1|nr:ECF transporter S component [Streptomyces fradiae]WOI59615.1 ECF transporter S component [Streptomyces fradiae]
MTAPAPTAPPAREARSSRPVRLGPRSVAALVLISAVGVAAFGWPLLADGGSGLAEAHAALAPWLFAGLLPLLVAVVVATIADSGMDAKAVAMLGVLAAVGAALRPLGAGTAGLEPMFFLMVLSGRVLGPGFGFVLGAVTMFASALLTGGVGPWMPYQMLSMAWFTMGAGLLPGSGEARAGRRGRTVGKGRTGWRGRPLRRMRLGRGGAPDRPGPAAATGPRGLRGRGELLMLAAYGAVASFAYGTAMNLQGWVLTLPEGSSGIAFHAGEPVHENLVRFAAFCLATSMGWDLGRAALTVVLTLTIGSSVLKALRRATRRAAFEAHVTFEGSEKPHPAHSGVRRPTGPTSHTTPPSGLPAPSAGAPSSRADLR